MEPRSTKYTAGEAMTERLVWVGALPGMGDVRSVVAEALAAGFDHIVLGKEDDSARGVGRFAPIFLRGDTFLIGGMEIGRLVSIQSGKDESVARGMRGATKHVVVRPGQHRIIPIENLIAYFQGSGTRLLVEVHDAAEAKLLLEAMEVGVDGIFLTPSSMEEIRAVRAVLETLIQRVPLAQGTVTSVRSLGLGDRVCVDTCSLFRTGEGLLVGNSSSGLFLVHAETGGLDGVASRPFRVNAGAVHAYVFVPGGATKYLSELGAGDEVLAVDSNGHARAVMVGRIKVERRPLLLIEAEVARRRVTTIVQNAETVRFVTPEGSGRSVSEMKSGDPVLLRTEEGGRHFGTRIRETIEER
ncbi:MAG TPA: 3-dehydroquinate synthase II [Thermoplasmata archaeon]|nr:3-dehydroquinate synthase II [Thermoplasmata archaeon]